MPSRAKIARGRGGLGVREKGEVAVMVVVVVVGPEEVQELLDMATCSARVAPQLWPARM